jgi:hypothetical protein
MLYEVIRSEEEFTSSGAQKSRIIRAINFERKILPHQLKTGLFFIVV